jgi:hypothetical protein
MRPRGTSANPPSRCMCVNRHTKECPPQDQDTSLCYCPTAAAGKAVRKGYTATHNKCCAAHFRHAGQRGKRSFAEDYAYLTADRSITFHLIKKSPCIKGLEGLFFFSRVVALCVCCARNTRIHRRRRRRQRHPVLLDALLQHGTLLLKIRVRELFCFA